MITWHPTGTGSYTASLTIGGMTIAVLHARRDAYQIEHLSGVQPGRANSVEHAKRAALEALAELIPRVLLEVQVALRRT